MTVLKLKASECDYSTLSVYILEHWHGVRTVDGRAYTGLNVG